MVSSFISQSVTCCTCVGGDLAEGCHFSFYARDKETFRCQKPMGSLLKGLLESENIVYICHSLRGRESYFTTINSTTNLAMKIDYPSSLFLFKFHLLRGSLVYPQLTLECLYSHYMFLTDLQVLTHALSFLKENSET